MLPCFIAWPGVLRPVRASCCLGNTTVLYAQLLYICAAAVPHAHKHTVLLSTAHYCTRFRPLCSVTVTNTGSMNGAHVVPLYLSNDAVAVRMRWCDQARQQMHAY